MRDRRVTIMGLGHFGGGAQAARWLARQGAVVTVTDLADERTLTDALHMLQRESIAHFHLGGHVEDDFRRADLVVVNPAVRPENALLRVARESGAELTSEIELFLRACPAPIVAVTGTNGKSTTAAMIAAILQRSGRRAWLGGNIGQSLLGRLERIRHDDWVVLEVSSFQLWHLGPNVSMPRVAVVTGCVPNHLDWHADFADYVAAKQRILIEQTRHDAAVLNTEDAEVAAWEPLVRGRLIPLPDLRAIPPLAVPGGHNRLNAACAAAAAEAVGCEWDDIRPALAGFGGLPQRLELVACVAGRRFYNDSTATTPESTVAALGAISEPVWLLAGGKDKGADLDDMVAAVVEKAAGAAYFGAARELLMGWTTARAPGFPCAAVETMAQAFDWCWHHSQPGEAIVLSPGCASVDQYRNFLARGAQFVELVRGLGEA